MREIERRIIFATGNEGKMKEIRLILEDLGLEILSMKEAGIQAEIREDGSSFEENAVIKARAVMELSGSIVLADDSGLEVDYLNKEPGIYSARYLGEDTSYHVKNRSLIGYEERGEGGFGYDPIFYLPEYGCSTAELSMEKKNELSHRGKALRAMKEMLREALDLREEEREE